HTGVHKHARTRTLPSCARPASEGGHELTARRAGPARAPEERAERGRGRNQQQAEVGVGVGSDPGDPQVSLSSPPGLPPAHVP
ncbi:Hypothetical predicted protein, partial [Marmota monax]